MDLFLSRINQVLSRCDEFIKDYKMDIVTVTKNNCDFPELASNLWSEIFKKVLAKNEMTKENERVPNLPLTFNNRQVEIDAYKLLEYSYLAISSSNGDDLNNIKMGLLKIKDLLKSNKTLHSNLEKKINQQIAMCDQPLQAGNTIQSKNKAKQYVVQPDLMEKASDIFENYFLPNCTKRLIMDS